MQLERRFLFPVSSKTICCCLSCHRRRAGLAVSDTDTQSPPDSRMNPSSKHPARLSLGRLLLSTSLVTRSSQVTPRLASSRNLKQAVKCACCDICMQQGLIAPRPTHATQPAPARLCTSPRGQKRSHEPRAFPSQSILAISQNRQAGLHRRAELSGKSILQRWQPSRAALGTQPTVPVAACASDPNMCLPADVYTLLA
jgi:hypothetical protein